MSERIGAVKIDTGLAGLLTQVFKVSFQAQS